MFLSSLIPEQVQKLQQDLPNCEITIFDRDADAFE